MTSVVWITGAHGFIGRHVARAFDQSGHTVCGVGHGLWPAHDAAQWGVKYWINGDVSSSNLSALAGAMGKPATVVHLAGGSSVGAAIAQPLEDFQRTVSSTAALLEWIRQESPSSALLAVSSAAVYGEGLVAPIGEGSRLNPYSPYGHHKAMVESLCRSYGASFGVRAVIARLFSVFGAGLRKQLLWDLCVKLGAGTREIELGGSGNETRDWIHVDDTARALLEVVPLASREAPTVNVASGRGVTVRRVAEIVIAEWLAQAGSAATLSFSGRSRAGDPQYLVADCARIAAVGWTPQRPLERSLAEYVSWFRSLNEGVD